MLKNIILHSRNNTNSNVRIVCFFKVCALTGYEPQDLIEKTLYQYVHSQDMIGIRSMHMTRKFFCFQKLSLRWKHSRTNGHFVWEQRQFDYFWLFFTMKTVKLVFTDFSIEQRTSEHKVLPIFGQKRRMGLGPKLCHHRS